MAGCGKFIGSHWIDDDLRMDVVCGVSIIRNNRQYCDECESKLPGCHEFMGNRERSFCGIPQGLSSKNIPTLFCEKCTKTEN